MKNASLILKKPKQPKSLGSFGKVAINLSMRASKMDFTEQECMEMEMSPVQREVFLIVDEWWKMYGYSPSIRDIAYQRGKSGLGNTMDIVNKLVRLGVLKKINGGGRSIRPVYINFKALE